MMKYLQFIVLILWASNFLIAQCSCTDCDVPLPPVGAASSTLNISGATNPTLGQNGQSLKAIHIHMVHDAIDELDITLIAPNGSSVLLSQYTGWSIGENITFDICFVACNETAMPDPGFPAEFDSQSGYLPDSTYTGIYYPSAGGGCLENLTGSVNGDWVLDFFDNVGLDGGTLFDWSLEFADNSGLGCQSVCNIVSCNADGGDIQGTNSQYCEVDPALSFAFTPTYPGSPPDPAEYDYTYVISDNTTDVILEYNTNPDLTSYTAGEYKICGLSYLISDLGLIPTANGSYTTGNLQDDITNNVFCADLSMNCEIVTIVSPLIDPDISGPLLLCEGDVASYTIENYDPALTYNVNITQGTYGAFNYSGGNTATVEWLSGPGQICFEVSNLCGTNSTCVDVTLDPLAPPIVITGNDVTCPGVVETYYISPPPGSSQSYDVTVDGGVIINQTSADVKIEWFINGGNNQLCVELQGSYCPPQPACFSVYVEDYQLPGDLNSPAELCIGESGNSFISPNSTINSYNWYGTDISITSGQGTNAVNYTVDQIGVVTICLEVETDCGTLGPVCQDITVTPPPDPVIDPFGPTCELSFSLNATVAGGNSVNWTQIDGPGGVTFSPNNQPFTNVTTPSPGIYTFVISEASPLCSGFDTIEIEVWESPDISNIEFNCELDEYSVSFDIIDGESPHSVNGTPISGNQFTSDLIPSGNSFTFTVTDANGCTDMISDSYVCPCISDAGTMSNSLLEICAPANEIAYAVHNNDAFLDGNDIGFYILHDNSGPFLGTIYDQNQNGQFTFLAGMNYGEVYYISYVVGNELSGDIDLNDPCLSVSIGQPVIFYDDPALSNTSAAFSCELEFPLSIDHSSGVQEIYWTQIAGPGFSTFSTPQDANTFVTVKEPGTYTYQVIAMNAACADTLIFNFEVYGPPVISNFQENCSSIDEFTLTFTVNGSGEPYSTNLPGSFSGNIFTSETLNTNNTYSITVTDINGCATDFTFGPIQCDCVSEAGTMDSDTILLCATDDSVHINFLGGGTLDGDDIESYIIHSGSSNLLVDPVFQTTRTSFVLPPVLQSGKMYYVSHAVGNGNNGQIDLNDPCLDVSIGQPLYIYPIPAFSIEDQHRTCENLLEVPVSNASNGTAYILSNSNNATVDFSVLNSSIHIDSDRPTILSIVYEEANRKCSRSDTFAVEFLSTPSFTNIQEICIGQSYVFSFDIQGGEPPFILNGNTLNGNKYISDTLPSGTPNTFVVRDANDCQSDTLRIEKDCSCLGEAGNTDMTPILLCEGDDIQLSLLNLRDTVLEEGDTLLYVVHNGSKDSIGNILASSDGGTIIYQPLFQTNINYYLTVITGDKENRALDFTDPCLDQTEGVLVNWRPLLNTTITSSDTTCINDSVSIDIISSGSFPFELFISSNMGRQKQIVVDRENFSIQLSVEYNNEIWVIDSVNGNCIGNLEGTIRLTGITPQVVDFNNSPELCNNELFGSTLDLNTLLTNPTVRGLWSSPDFEFSGSVVDFDMVVPGRYTFHFTTEGFELPCPGDLYSTTVEVIECDCPSLLFPGELSFCNTTESFDLDSLVSLSLEGNWSLQNPGQHSRAPQIQADVLDILNASPGMYQLTYTLTEDLPVQCQNTYTLDLRIEAQLSSGVQSFIPLYCKGTNGDIDLFTLLDNADPGGIWMYSDTIIESPLSLEDYTAGIHEFHYSHTASTICAEETTMVRLEIATPPRFDVITTNISCYQAQDGSMEIAIEEDIYAPYIVYLDGNRLEDTTISGLSAGSYTIEVENAKGCTQRQTNLIIVEPDPLSVELGDDITLSSNASHTFTAIPSIPDSAIHSIRWFTSTTEIEQDALVYTQSYTEKDILTVQITNQAGCMAEDQVIINIRGGDIYIPNVFRPNSQNVENQKFGIIGHQNIASITSFRIFDRWGNLLFNKQQIMPGTDEAFWDGWVGTDIAPTGVYMYAIEYIDSNGKTRFLHGDVTLLP